MGLSATRKIAVAGFERERTCLSSRSAAREYRFFRSSEECRETIAWRRETFAAPRDFREDFEAASRVAECPAII